MNQKKFLGAFRIPDDFGALPPDAKRAAAEQIAQSIRAAAEATGRHEDGDSEPPAESPGGE